MSNDATAEKIPTEKLNGRLPPMEQKFLDLLWDGRTHSVKEMLLLGDPDGLMDFRTLTVHICNLRKKLPNGLNIVCVLRYRRKNYQLVRRLHSANDE